MSEKNVWLVTGAGRGLGTDITRAALNAGHQVIATGRNAARVTEAVGEHANLFVVELDITDPASIKKAVEASVQKFGSIDVLVNNAGNFYAGYFEELSADDIRQQLETLLIGPMNVTREILPVMRKQRAGKIITLSSSAGFIGQVFCSAYAAAKFGTEGWMESLAPEVAPFGIQTMIVEPGFFRTELLTDASTRYSSHSIEDYAESSQEIVKAWKGMDGKQGGDPVKLAEAIVSLEALDELPARFVAGADAVEGFEQKLKTVQSQIDAHRSLSVSLNLD